MCFVPYEDVIIIDGTSHLIGTPATISLLGHIHFLGGSPPGTQPDNTTTDHEDGRNRATSVDATNAPAT